MVRGNLYGRRNKQLSLEPFPPLRVQNRMDLTGVGTVAVVEDEEVGDASSCGRDLDSFDIRDLLLDESD